jgi:23S rRNA pseudouridine1911/1915/1917 synthase
LSSLSENTNPEGESNPSEELYEHHRYVVDPGQEPLRIDKFLMDRMPNTSRSKIQDATKNGFIWVDDKNVKTNYKVQPGEVIRIEMPYPVRELELIAQDIPIDIVYEDDTLAIINKAAGMVVHPAYGNYTGTLVNALMFHFQNLPEASDAITPRPGIVHRLDKNTTGLMIIAKNEFAMAHLSKQFFDRTTDRKYQALVWGDIIEDGTIEGNIGRSLQDRKVMAVFEDDEMGKKAITHYKVLKRYGYVTLVECKLETGRTHQIRAHFKHENHPLFNDDTYKGDRIVKGTTFSKYKQFVMNCFTTIPRHALHAKSIGFTHPKTGERMSFESELPEDMVNVLKKWDTYINAYNK